MPLFRVRRSYNGFIDFIVRAASEEEAEQRVEGLLPGDPLPAFIEDLVEQKEDFETVFVGKE